VDSEQNLIEGQCVPCRGGVDPLTADECAAYLPMIEDWSLVQRDGIDQLERVFSFDSYMEGAGFTQRVVELAEQEDHHPSIVLEWGKVTVTWWTHKINGLHQNDFICAAKTNTLA